ncbi:hypothetical protein DFJ74DRAFT_690695 [Hyaloraphidium curvatum]|nr:hypothetical protein DFJ74DRAFT_690695 [Hyaloraphidium curvatum]
MACAPPRSRFGGNSLLAAALDNPLLLFSLRRRVTDAGFSHLLAILAAAKSAVAARDAGLRVVQFGATTPDGRRVTRLYVQLPAHAKGAPRLIPIAGAPLKDVAKAAAAAPAQHAAAVVTKTLGEPSMPATVAKAAAETAQILKDPLGQVVKEVKENLPTVEAVAKAEDLGVKAAKNLVERAKIGVDLIQNAAAATPDLAVPAASTAPFADAFADLAIQHALAVDAARAKQRRAAVWKTTGAVLAAVSLAAAAAGAAYLYRQGRLDRDSLAELLRAHLPERLNPDSLAAVWRTYFPGSQPAAPPSDAAPSDAHAEDLFPDDPWVSGEEPSMSLLDSVSEDDVDTCDAGVKKLMLRDDEASVAASPASASPAFGAAHADLSMSAISESSAEGGRSADEWVVVQQGEEAQEHGLPVPAVGEGHLEMAEVATDARL